MAKERDVIAELYAAPPEEFVAQRTRLTRELRDDGRSEEAQAIAALRKPTLPAYLANRLAHDRPREVAALLDAAKELAAAHGSGDAEKLRRVQGDLGEQVRKLVGLASEVSGRSVSESAGQRLAETLRAAATDPETTPFLRRGVLQEEVETSGFEALAGVKLSPAKQQAQGASKATSKAPSPGTRRTKAADARVEQLRQDVAAARKELRSAETAAAAAEREAARARRRVSELEARLERLTVR
jgi:hypothetical protein